MGHATEERPSTGSTGSFQYFGEPFQQKRSGSFPESVAIFMLQLGGSKCVPHGVNLRVSCCNRVGESADILESVCRRHTAKLYSYPGALF